MSKFHEQKILQKLIDSGEISNAEELLYYTSMREWGLKRVSKRSDEGLPQIGIRISHRNVFRLRCKFEVDSLFRSKIASVRFLPDENIHPNFEHIGVWIYVLVSHSGQEKACYVGQTKRCLRRFKEHLRLSKSGRGSSELFKWAHDRNADIHVALLDYIPNNLEKSDTAKMATLSEGTWLNLAVDAGYHTPAIERWGNLPASPEALNNSSWPENEINQISISINEVVHELPSIFAFSLPSLINRIKAL